MLARYGILLVAHYGALAASWVVTSYLEQSISADTYAEITYTEIWPVSPTGPVKGKPVSTTTYERAGITITAVEVVIPTDAPASNITDICLDASCPPVTVTSVYAPLVITAPSTCNTQFTYTTPVSLITFPTEILPQITDASTTSYHTSVNPAELLAGTTEWNQVDVYLPSNVVTPPIPTTDLGWLHECIDPRKFNCPLGNMESGGCPSATGSGSYPVGAASATATQTDGVARVSDVGGQMGMVLGVMAALFF